MRSYYDAVQTADYETSWAQLAPEFQRGKAVSYEYYVEFWDANDIAVGEVELIESTGDQAIVHVDLYWNGSAEPTTDRFTLRPGPDGQPLIAAQRTADS